MLTRYNFFDTFDFVARNAFSPAVDVYEDEKEITVEVELPGMDEKDLDLKVESNVLTISGEKKKGSDKKNKGYFRSERVKGYFSRSFSLPKSASVEEISATYKDGILFVRVPKELKDRSKKIKIDT